MKRLIELDHTKGFAILILLLSHCMGEENALKTWISSWNMPIFFIICGLIHQLRNPDGLPLDKLKTWCKHRIIQIFIPYFIFSLLYIIFLNGLSWISEGKTNILNECISVITMHGIASMWFLPIYFFSEILYTFLMVKLPRIIQILFIVIVIILVTSLQHNNEIISTDKVMQLLLKISVALSFVILGGMWSKYFIRAKIPIYFILISLLISSIIALYNGFIGIGALLFNNIILFFIIGTIISYIILMLFKVINTRTNPKYLNILSTFGANSIVVLVTNNLLIELFRLLEYKVFNNFFLENGVIGAFLMTAILIIPEYYLISISQSKIGILFGKKIQLPI